MARPAEQLRTAINSTAPPKLFSPVPLRSTPDPNTFSYNDDFTVTTNHGVLKTHNVGIFDVATGLFSEIARIDPNASTGDFAGATGVLYINGKTADG